MTTNRSIQTRKYTGAAMPVLLALTLLHTTLLCEALSRNNREAATQEKPETQMRHGLPLLFPPRTADFGVEARAQIAAPSLLLYRDSQTPVSDTGSFQPLPGPYGGTVRSIAVDRGGWLFIATDGGVYRSKDNGAHWDTHPFPAELYSVVDPVAVLGPGVVAAVTNSSTFISTDRGDSWDFMSEAARGFAVDTNGDIYAGSDGLGIIRSTDTARSWTPFALPGKTIWKVVLCGEGRIACTSDSGVFRSSNAGTTWTFTPNDEAYSANLVGDQRGDLFGIRGFDLSRSTDFGRQWQQVIFPAGADQVYRLYLEEGDSLFAVTYQEIYLSTDLGDSWSSLGTPISEPLTVGRDVGGSLLAGSFYGVHRFDEITRTWTPLNSGIHSRRIERIQFTQSGSMLVLSLGECFRSTDAGNSWSKAAPDSATWIGTYAPILSSSTGAVFIPAYLDNATENGLLRSTDDGVSWQKIPVLPGSSSFTALAERVSGELIAGTLNGDIYRSTDNGDSWSRVFTSSAQSAIRSLASDKEGNCYAAADASVLLSRDGLVWNKAPVTTRPAVWKSITVDAPGRVFLCTFGDGVVYSTDRGASWGPTSGGFFNSAVLCSAADDSGNVALATPYGVFLLADSIDSWIPFGNGFPRTVATSVAFSPDHVLFAGTQDFGMFRTLGPMEARLAGNSPVPPPPGREPIEYALLQNFPNPFNGRTVIRYTLPSPADVEITVYSVLGQVVSTLFSGAMPAGTHDVAWSPEGIASGVYFCRMTAGSPGQTYRRTIKALYVR